MKTTKVIEITLCDVCGQEKRHQDWPCARCKRDICDACEESFRIEMSHSSRERRRYGMTSSRGTSHINLGAVNRVCKDCAVVIVDGLNALGLVGKPKEDVEKFMAVMD
jgi:hypothetical protein